MNVIKTITPILGAERFNNWKKLLGGANNINFFSYISDICHPEDMLIFCGLLFPDFVRVREFVILERNYDNDIFLASLKDKGALGIEKSFNSVWVYDVFAGTRNVPEIIYEQLSDVIAMSWGMLLKSKFPDKDFQVDVVKSELNYGPTITFYQIHGGD